MFELSPAGRCARANSALGLPPRGSLLRMFTLAAALGALLVLLSSPARALDVAQVGASGVTTLDGTWELRLGEEGPWREAQVPGNLSFHGVPYDGIAWFRRSFDAPTLSGARVQRDLALRLPMTANAYEVYVNGKALGGRGRIGPGGELLEKDFRASVFRIPSDVLSRSGSNQLELRVRTFYGNGGVMAPGVLLGPEDSVREAHERRGLRSAILVALFAFAGFFHLVLFAGRRRERHHLWFSLFCFALGSVTAGINTLGYLLSVNPDFNAYLVFVPLVALPHLVVQFWSSFFEQPSPRWRLVTLATAALGALSLVGATLYHPLYPYFEGVVFPLCILVLVAALGASVWWTIRAQRQGQRGANVILFGVAVYSLSASLEMAWAFRLIGVYVDSNLGFAVLVGSMVVAIASRFAWLHERAELGERDQLTGCLTRHGFREPLRVECENHDRGSGELSCILLDLDHFKQINDLYGHNVGDRVLTAMGHAISGALRGSDLVARWGGEEFLILLPGQSLNSAIEIAHRVLEAVRNVRFEDIPSLRGSASFGVACRIPHERFEEWLERADGALYKAKGAGRACVRAA
jgi:diguanylate cyclase (GGDEF)-like protein